MKILHTSDWHLGKSLGGQPLEEDQRFALGQINDHLRTHAYDLLVISGDIFDRATPTPEAVRMLGAWLGEVRAIAAALPMVIIAGNHDSGPRLAWAASLLDVQQVYLRGDCHRIEEPIAITGADGVEAQVWALPFLLPGALGGAEPTQVGEMDEALRRIRATWDRSKAQILIAHCFVRGGEVSESERGLIGTATQIDAEVFEGFDYVALGHLHRPQTVAPNARYSGSIARYSFSEAGHDKSLLAIEVRPGQPHTHVRHPIACLRRMHVITDSLHALLHDRKYDDRVGDYVKLTLEPPVDLGNPHDALRDRWSHILSFQNDLVGTAAGASPVRGGGDGPRDLEADFVDFDKQFSPGEARPDEILGAFRALHARVPENV